MSYILDALRKANLERGRGAVPGLHAQPVPALPIEPPSQITAKPWPWIVAGAACALLIVIGAAYFAAYEEPVRQPERQAPAEAPAAGAVARTATPERPIAVATPAPWPAPPNPSAQPPAPAKAPASVAAAAPVEPAVGSRDQLPADIRAGLPPLAIGGSIYSPSAGNRSVIIDGRLYREGELVTPGLVVEQIKLKAAVLSYRGHRFELNF